MNIGIKSVGSWYWYDRVILQIKNVNSTYPNMLCILTNKQVLHWLKSSFWPFFLLGVIVFVRKAVVVLVVVSCVNSLQRNLRSFRYRLIWRCFSLHLAILNLLCLNCIHSGYNIIWKYFYGGIRKNGLWSYMVLGYNRACFVLVVGWSFNVVQ